MTAAADSFPAALSAFVRAAGFAALALGVVLALAFAAAAAAVIGFLIAGAALAHRFWPKRARAEAPQVLEARRTPTGWVVEASASRRPS